MSLEMPRQERIWREFLEKHAHADVLVFDEESKMPVEARYRSGFTTKAERDADLKAFFELVARELGGER